MPSRANQNSTHGTRAAAAAAEQQHQKAADQIYMSPFIMHQPPTAEHMQKGSKKTNTARLKCKLNKRQFKQYWERWSSKPTKKDHKQSQQSVGEKRGGIPKGSTISFRQFSTTLVNREKKTRTGFFYLANSGMREETNKNTSTNTHLNNRIN